MGGSLALFFLYWVLLYWNVLTYPVLYYFVLFHAVLNCTLLYYITLCSTELLNKSLCWQDWPSLFSVFDMCVNQSVTFCYPPLNCYIFWRLSKNAKEYDMLEVFICSRYLNNNINLPNIMWSFAIVAAISLVGQIQR